MATKTVPTLPAAGEESERGVDLLAIVIALASEWRVGAIAFAVTFVALVIVTMCLTPQYVAKAVILPGSTRGAAGGTLAMLFPGSSTSGMYTGLLESRTVQDGVIDRAGLMKNFNTSSRETARGILKRKTTIKTDTDSLITISVKDKDANVAAQIANAYLDSLKQLNNKMSLEESGETRDFFKDQIQEERNELATAETQLESAQQRTGVVQPEAQTQLGLSAIANVRSQINQLQVQLAALLRGATEENPQVQRLKAQIAQFQAEERALESGTTTAPTGAAPPARQLPQSTLDVLRAQREVVFHNALVNALAGQFETARTMQEAARPEFQVVDRATPPEHKAWPPRLAFVIAAFVLGLLVACGVITMRLVWRRMENDPTHSQQLAELRRVVRH